MGIGDPQQPVAPSDLPEALEEQRSGAGAFPIVGVGASAGGLEAYTQLLGHSSSRWPETGSRPPSGWSFPAPARTARWGWPRSRVERSSDRSQGGLGIGLTPVRLLVEMHGGSVSVSSTPGAGSAFTVRLPLEEGQPGPRPASTSPATVSPPRRILIVDDNTDLVRGLAQLLGRSGHDVQAAHDGPSGLEAARAYRPEIMLLDIDLPGMDGYEVADRLRREEGLEDVVIIAISGCGPWADPGRSRVPIFDHYLVKPVAHDELLALLGRAGRPDGRERDAEPRG